MPLLQPGEYQIQLSKNGFKGVTETGIVLQVNEQARQDFTLDVGAVVDSVTITSTVPLLETATAARGQVIDNQKIVDLPLNGRDYLQLALLSVGAGQVPYGRLNSFCACGQSAYDNAYLLDGVDNNTLQRASQSRRAEVIKPSIDAVQEFKVLTNAYSAEFGRAGGGIVSLSIKSGTNASARELCSSFCGTISSTPRSSSTSPASPLSGINMDFPLVVQSRRIRRSSSPTTKRPIFASRARCSAPSRPLAR